MSGWLYQPSYSFDLIRARARYIFPYGKGSEGQQACTCKVYFWGTGVPQDVYGLRYDLAIPVEETYTLQQLKTGVLSAVSAKASALGFSISRSNIFMDSYETG